MTSSEGLLSSMVENDGLSVSISEAVLVEGGLCPPPSKFYPGRKCYMVTVNVKGRGEYGGFGPSPGIARRSAIMEACKSLPCNGISTETCFADQVSDSDSETEDFQVAKLPLMDSSSSPPAPPAKTSSEDRGISSVSPVKKSSEDLVINLVHDLAKQKGVELKSEVIVADQEVIAVVHCGKMSFVGRNRERRLAQLEAALKMQEALQLLPDRPSSHPRTMLPLLPAPKLPLALPQNPRHQSYNPHPFRRPFPPPPLPHPKPVQQPSSNVPLQFPRTSSRFSPLQHVFPLPLPPPPKQLEEVSSDEGEEGAQPLSLGLREVVPSKASISIRPMSPFESYPNPCQFTVPLPRPRAEAAPQSSLQPPWKTIGPKEEAGGAGNKNRKSFKTCNSGKSGHRKPQKAKSKPKSPTMSLPTHFLLKDVEWDGHVEAPASSAAMVSCPGLPTEGAL